MVSKRQEGTGQEASRREPAEPPAEKRISSVAEIEAVLTAVAAEMGAAGYPEGDVFAMRLALDEALINAIKHGNRGDPGKVVRVQWRIAADSALVEVEDEGEGFDPERVPDPRAPENLERSSGRGLFLMRAYTTWVRYNERGNRVTLCKYRSLT